MVVAPNDYAAWSQATGNPYPATPADKAAVTNQVIAWKSQQTAAARESRGPSAIATPLAIGVGSAGLGLAGLLAFNHFRKQGLTEPHAAELAKQVENSAQAAAAVTTAPPPPPAQQAATASTPANYRVTEEQDVLVRPRPDSFQGPRLRADDESGPTALTIATTNGRSMGGTQAREQGQYKARTDSGFHDPALASLDTTDKRNLYLAAIAENHGTDSPQFEVAQALIQSMEATTPGGVEPTSFINGMDARQRYGTDTAEDQAASGNFLAQSRQKSNASAQANFRSRESAPQSAAKVYSPQAQANRQDQILGQIAAETGPFDMGATAANSSPGSLEDYNPEVHRQLLALDSGNGNLKAPKPSEARRPDSLDPKKASVFFIDTDGTYRPYMGSSPVIGKGDAILSTGRRADGSPIAESDLAYFPTDDPDFYARSGLTHPFLSHDEILINASNRSDPRFATDEDSGIKGMLESLPASDPRFSDGIRKDGVADNWTISRVVKDGERVPLDVSGFQSEMQSPGAIAGARLKMALEDHQARTGQQVPAVVANAWVADLAQQHGVDGDTVIRAAVGRAAPAPTPSTRASSPALAAGTGDALDRVYNSLGMHATENAWDLEQHIRSGNIKGAAAALAAQLPALTAANASGLRGIGQDEKLNIVAEGIAAGLKDLSIATEKYPEAAAKYGIGKGAGGFGVDGFLKSYVRDWVTVRGLQLDPTGQPTYQVPNDAFEILAHQASVNGHSTLHELENHVRGSANGLLGALKIDRIVSSAQSTKPGDPNNNATAFAQTIFDLHDPDLLSTQLTNEAASDVKLSFGTRRNYDVTAGFYDRNPNESQIDEANYNYRSLRENEEITDENGKITNRMVDATAPYGTNATLAARVSGADYKTPEGQARRAESEAAQQWITQNADGLERQRADLNRGIINLDNTPRSFGRGFVITSDHRGAHLAGDTQGMNTFIRDENFNDDDTTPLDVAQDNERDAQINNQIPAPEGVEIGLADEAEAKARRAEREFYAAGSRRGAEADQWNAAASASLPKIRPSEADAIAQQYGGSKLYFKNLGPNSRGAMPEGDAAPALSRLLASQALTADTIAYAQKRHPRAPWTPEPGIGFEVGASSPIRGIGPRPAPGPAPITLSTPPEHEPTRVMTPKAVPGGAIDLDRRTLQHSTQAPYATVMPEGWRPNFNDPVVQAGVFGAPRAIPATSGSLEAADNYTSALNARAAGSGEGFRDDQNFRDAQLIASGYLDRARAANAAASAAAMQVPGGPRSPEDRTGIGGAQGIALHPATPRQAATGLQFDSDSLSGVGRRGSTFAQAPIAAAPVSAIPAAAIEQLNTLRSSMERPVADYTDREAQVARVSHSAEYMDKLYANGLTKNAKPRQVGSNRMSEYAAPSDATISGRVKWLRKAGIL